MYVYIYIYIHIHTYIYIYIYIYISVIVIIKERFQRDYFNKIRNKTLDESLLHFKDLRTYLKDIKKRYKHSKQHCIKYAKM